jgi:glutathione S-transferase
MMQLHYYPSNASFTPHVLLHEVGAPFELTLVKRMENAHKQTEYLKLNPNGLIPVLVDGELVLYETAAICLYLADKFPAAALAPPLGSVQRAHFYKWLAWLTNTLQATLIVYFYPERWVNDGDAGAAAQVKAHAMAKVQSLLELLDAQLASHSGPWLLGAEYSAVDPYAFMLCRWTRGFNSRPARDYPNIAPYLKRVLERPAVQQVFAAEELAAPPY